MFGFRKSEETQFKSDLSKIAPRVWRYALTLTGSRPDADDLSQAACLRAMERRQQFQFGTRLDRWVFAIAHNLWVSELRREKLRNGNGVIAIELADLEDPGLSADVRLERKQVFQTVFQLPEAQRQAMMLVYVEGYSYADAAIIMDIPVGTVMSRLAAARSQLSHKFGDIKGTANAR